MNQLSFFNTTGEKGGELDKYESQAQDQETKILSHLKNFPNDWFTPEEITEEVFNNNVPRSSIARALANLTKNQLLLKSGKANAIGKYGRPVHTWKYRRLKIT